MSDLVRLTQLAREIAAQSGGPTIPYRRAYSAAIDAEIPTVYIRGRHYVQRSDLPAIARHFGIALASATEETTAA